MVTPTKVAAVPRPLRRDVEVERRRFGRVLPFFPERADPGSGPSECRAKDAPDYAPYSRALQTVLTGYADGAVPPNVAPIPIAERQR
jgi:hypothetical protein